MVLVRVLSRLLIQNELVLKIAYKGGGISSVKSWSDKQSGPGSLWCSKINSALANTKVAVLLVTPEFFYSDFIHEHELSPLLKEAQQSGVRILWVPVRDSRLEADYVENYQAVLDLGKQLAGMTKAKRDLVWVRICEEIKKAVNEHATSYSGVLRFRSFILCWRDNNLTRMGVESDSDRRAHALGIRRRPSFSVRPESRHGNMVAHPH